MLNKYRVILPVALAALAGLFLGGGVARAAEPSPNEMVNQHLYAPELIKLAQQELKLTDEQTAFIQAEVQKAEQRVLACQAQIRKEAEALLPALKAPRIDEEKALAQSETILYYESEIKRAQLALLIRLKNKLTAEQQALLKQRQARQAAIQEKWVRVRAQVLQWQQEGRDLTPLQPFKEQFDPLMKEGKWTEAEAILDQALKTLEAKPKK